MHRSREIKQLKYQSLKGFSDYQIKKHHEIVYADHVKRLNAIENKIDSLNASQQAQPQDFWEVKIEEVAEKNAVKLHEAYFTEMSTGTNHPVGEIAKLIKDDFGSYEAWKKEFMTAAIASRGWVILAYDLDDNKLVNYLIDLSQLGGVWNAVIILAIDCCEHSYSFEGKPDHQKYVEAFMKNVDWDYVNLEAHQYGIIDRRKNSNRLKL